MIRREWLQKNPPPKVASQLRQLLQQLNEQNQARNMLTSNRQIFQQHVAYWTQIRANAQAQNDIANMNHATLQLNDFQSKIQQIDTDLAATMEVPGKITELTSELNQAAKCPVHQRDLLRHKNRPDDLFLCEVGPNGPHFFLWTLAGNKPAFAPVDLQKPLPDLNGEMDWL